ncbi:MAG: Uncharacterized protein Greene07144_164 [Parcubacteria group bacterium Greene0714_4]|nr:MAG: Uncharacterized protein Greene101415_163 [Parcubacteria group bacterium Greene1014_15]TSD08369.1 MAG: Uncharacterized protein Greene07144_164 [Parcubacteria group bacterium Greene0714_4]
MLSQYTKIRMIIAIIVCLFLIGVFLFVRRDKTVRVATFDECIKAGYAVIDSFPKRCLDNESIVHIEDVGNMVEMQNEIQINAPERNTVITANLVILGKARKDWFVDGKISGSLVDTEGIVLGQFVAEAEKGNINKTLREFSGKMIWRLRDTDALKGSIVLKKGKVTGTGSEIRMPVFLRPD